MLYCYVTWKDLGKEAEHLTFPTSGSTQEVQQKVCQPGEIRQEYENFLAQETQEAIQRKNKEEVASIKLIQQLQVRGSKLMTCVMVVTCYNPMLYE